MVLGVADKDADVVEDCGGGEELGGARVRAEDACGAGDSADVVEESSGEVLDVEGVRAFEAATMGEVEGGVSRGIGEAVLIDEGPADSLAEAAVVGVNDIGPEVVHESFEDDDAGEEDVGAVWAESRDGGREVWGVGAEEADELLDGGVIDGVVDFFGGSPGAEEIGDGGDGAAGAGEERGADGLAVEGACDDGVGVSAEFGEGFGGEERGGAELVGESDGAEGEGERSDGDAVGGEDDLRGAAADVDGCGG